MKFVANTLTAVLVTLCVTGTACSSNSAHQALPVAPQIALRPSHPITIETLLGSTPISGSYPISCRYADNGYDCTSSVDLGYFNLTTAPTSASTALHASFNNFTHKLSNGSYCNITGAHSIDFQEPNGTVHPGILNPDVNHVEFYDSLAKTGTYTILYDWAGQTAAPMCGVSNFIVTLGWSGTVYQGP